MTASPRSVWRPWRRIKQLEDSVASLTAETHALRRVAQIEAERADGMEKLYVTALKKNLAFLDTLQQRLADLDKQLESKL